MTSNFVRYDGYTAYIVLTDTRGQIAAEALLDATDVQRVVDFGRWRLASGGYVRSYTIDILSGKRKDMDLHRFLLNPANDMVVDHINHNRLDNRRANLRVLTRAENMQNRRGPVVGKELPFRNVYQQPKGGGFAVRIRGQYFGTYKTVEEANEVACRMRPQVMQYST